MKSLQPLHSKYIKDSINKLNEYTAQVNEQTDAVHHLFLLLGAFDVTWKFSTVTLDGIKQIIDGVPIEGIKYYYTDDEIDNVISTCKLDSFLLRSYIKSIILHVRKIKTLTKLINYYKVCSEIPYSIFKETIQDINLDNQKYVLKGGILHLGFGVGNIYIREKKRYIDSNDTKYNQKVINWNDSLKTLVIIAKEQEERNEHNLYTQYTSNLINKVEFIKLMKPYTYNKIDCPDKPKWLIYHINDYNYWITWEKIPFGLANLSYYSFVPNRIYAEVADKRMDYIKSCKSTEDILNEKSYGFQDKVNMLIKFDTTYHLNYKR